MPWVQGSVNKTVIVQSGFLVAVSVETSLSLAIRFCSGNGFVNKTSSICSEFSVLIVGGFKNTTF